MTHRPTPLYDVLSDCHYYLLNVDVRRRATRGFGKAIRFVAEEMIEVFILKDRQA